MAAPKIKGGYYIKARQIQNSKIAHAPPHIREIWDWLIKEANHTDKRYSGFIVKRGQLFRTYREIREGLHWMVGYRKMMYSKDQIKKAMRYLRGVTKDPMKAPMKDPMIATTKAPGGVLITILNYDLYQNPKNYESTDESTNEAPIENHPIPYNNKNEKNEKNEKKKEYSVNFMSFWNAYPVKKGKAVAYKSWKKQKPDLDIVLSAIERQTEEKEKLRANNQFCPEWPHPTTWLNQARWEDEDYQITEEGDGLTRFLRRHQNSE